MDFSRQLLQFEAYARILKQLAEQVSAGCSSDASPVVKNSGFRECGS
jgi:hypothetical protein